MRRHRRLRDFFKKNVIWLLIIMSLLTACAKTNDDIVKATERIKTMPAEKTENEWAVYWYLCGSDLESRFGSASADLEELMSRQIPESVEFVIETGGASEWKRSDIDPTKRQRFVWNHEGWKLEDESEQVNMGESSSLSDFLNYCVENHDGKRKMLILWNHGGGTLGGISYDENYNMDSLSIPELKNALEESGITFDIIGFDACLMSNIDTILAVADYGKYMIASEELEPGNGWDYAGFSDILSNEGADTIDIGIEICDAFYRGCESVETEKGSTLALIDLSVAEKLEQSFENCGDDLLLSSISDDAIATALIRGAKTAENYGANSKEEGFTNMVDLVNLTTMVMEQAPDLQSEKNLQEMINTVEEAVVYQVRGEFRGEGAGISCYYPLDNSLRSLLQFRQNQGNEEIRNLYQYLITGELNEELLRYLDENNYNNDELIRSHITVNTMGLSDIAPSKTDEKLSLHIGTEAAKYITMVQGFTGVLNEESMEIYCFGSQRCQIEDWEKGIFQLKMPTEWWALDGHYVYTFLVATTKEYSIYSIPVVINGEDYFIRAAHDYNTDSMSIISVSSANTDTYIPDRMENSLEDGDIITTKISYLNQISGDGTSLYEYETFEYNKDMTFTRIPLPNGIACGIFTLFDAWGNHVYSRPIIFDILDGEAW